MIISPNRELLVRVATRLQPLLDGLVFVGGQVTELLITDPAATRVRPTDDVDVICQVANRPEYFRLGKQLKALGFSEDSSPGAPMCRWRAGGDVLDVMPTDEEILRFKGSWYSAAIRTAQSYQLSASLAIRIASAPAFLATKWEAHHDRGADWYGSHDLEDIVLLVAGRPELLSEIADTEPDIRAYLKESTQKMLDAGVTSDVIASSLPETQSVPGLLSNVSRLFEEIALQP